MQIPSNQQAVVWGAGGHARVVLDILQLREISVLGLVDDTRQIEPGEQFIGVPLYPSLEAVPLRQPCWAFVAIGDNTARKRKGDFAEQLGFRLLTLVHPHAIVARDVELGAGTVVTAGAVINPGAVIGKSVIVNTMAVIEHECVVQEGVHVGPGARLGGKTRLGSLSWIGIGATVIDKIAVGERSIVGAGSVVIRDIPEGVVAAGVPARIIRSITSAS